MIDFKITDDFDLSFAENGDFETVDTYETAIPCGMFLEKRYEIDTGILLNKIDGARGHFGFKTDGSYLWKLYQARLTTATLNEARLYATDGLSFLSRDNLVESISASSSVSENDIILNIKVIDKKNEIERSFKL